MHYLKKSIRDIDLKGKKVLLRVDYNVPQDPKGNIMDDKRIVESIPTIKYLIEQNAAIIICSHLGRPAGERNMKYTLTPVARHLSSLLGKDVRMAFDAVGGNAERLCAALQPGEILMLENLRFDPGEEENDPVFARKLASYADIYVAEAFGACHRAHASIIGVAQYIPAVCGFLIEKELEIMGKAMDSAEHPFVAIMGGAKIGDKLGLIESFIGKCDSILIVGGMAYTFFKALGGNIGTSIFDAKNVQTMGFLMENAEKRGTKIYLPLDTVVAREFSDDAEFMTVPSGQIPDDYMGMDIGPETVKFFGEIIKNAKTIIWNGPAGVFEMPNFAKGTEGIARAIAASDAVSIIGGGDSASAIEKFGLSDCVTHVSTGGGAALEFLEGRDMPGIACLMDREAEALTI